MPRPKPTDTRWIIFDPWPKPGEEMLLIAVAWMAAKDGDRAVEIEQMLLDERDEIKGIPTRRGWRVARRRW